MSSYYRLFLSPQSLKYPFGWLLKDVTFRLPETQVFGPCMLCCEWVACSECSWIVSLFATLPENRLHMTGFLFLFLPYWWGGGGLGQAV